MGHAASHEADHRHHAPRARSSRRDHGHAHGPFVDPSLASTARGMRAVWWSLVGLLATALVQLAVVAVSGSVALLADTFHNFADAGTAIPLWVAFALSRRPSNPRFSHGYGRAEDLAGAVVVLTIVATAIVAGYESVRRLLQPEPVAHLWAVAGAAIVGFLGNEAVALYRIRVGREIGSAALVADGHHAHADGLVSLAVLLGAGGVALGYPLADPLVGGLITLLIAWVAWQSGREVVTRMLDGVDPEVLAGVTHAAQHAEGVREVTETRARWVGHRLSVELNVAVDPTLTVAAGHAVAKEVRHQILHHLPHVSRVTVHVDPATESGELHHRVDVHAHDDLPPHPHG
jgi:cation diffusion facilitator family transporter